jgi:hypothetical protein
MQCQHYRAEQRLVHQQKHQISAREWLFVFEILKHLILTRARFCSAPLYDPSALLAADDDTDDGELLLCPCCAWPKCGKQQVSTTKTMSCCLLLLPHKASLGTNKAFSAWESHQHT